MLLNFVHNELANGSIGGEPIDSDDVIFTFSFSLIKLNSEFGILYKHSVSLSLSLSLSLFILLSSLLVIAHYSTFLSILFRK